MAAPEHKSVYTIPENFIDEGRMVRGMFRTRYFLEGLAMALVVALIISFFPLNGLKEKITAYTLGCSPFLMLGITGIGGDPVFVFVKNCFTWLKQKGIYFYNGAARALASSPVENMMENEDARAKLNEYVERMRKKREESRTLDLVEGVDFEFAEDKDLAGNYADEEYEVEEDEDDYSVSPEAFEEDRMPEKMPREQVRRITTMDPTIRGEDGERINSDNDSDSDSAVFGSWEDEVF